MSEWDRAAAGWDADPAVRHDADAALASLEAAGLVDVSVETAFTIDVGGHTMAPLMGSAVRPPLRC